MKKNGPRPSVFNRQRRIAVDTGPLQRFVERLSERLALRKSFSVVLVSDAVMRNYNSHYRGKRVPTDVLSFPYQPEPWENDPGYAGDILISAETAEHQKQGSLLEELQVLSLHGVLHLLGHDHETDQGQMDALEAELKREFRLT